MDNDTLTSGADAPIRLGLYIAEFTLLGMVGLITADLLLRNLVSLPILFTGEVSGYLLVLIALLGLPYSLRRGLLLRIDLLIMVLPFGVKRAFAVVYNFVALLVAGILLWQFSVEVLANFQRETLAPTLLRTPIWLAQLSMPLGGALLCYGLLLELKDSIVGKLH